MNRYSKGLDVLGGDVIYGDGILDFIPALNIASKLTSGGGSSGGGGGISSMIPGMGAPSGGTPAGKTGGDTQSAIKQALKEEHARQVAEKAASDAKMIKIALIGLLGAVTIGGAVLLFRRH